LYSEAGVSSLQTTHLPQHRLGRPPQDPACAACPARFRVSKELLWLSRCDFGLQKYFRRFPCAFSRFKSAFVAFPARFRASKVLLLLSRRIFRVQKYFCALPDAFSVFKRTFVAFPAYFRASKILLLLSLRGFGFQKRFSARAARVSIRFTQKSSYSEEFLWQRL
ncbi:MAG: hypothetical protein K2N31_04500, partial [Treponemataceae bacterium]|nr:hypothetical protein [Treponemataceae bacterium]